MKKIAILSNINLDWLTKILSSDYNVFQTYGYNTWVQEVVNQNSNLYDYYPDYVFFIFDGLELLKNDVQESIEYYFELISKVKTNLKSSKIFVSDLDIFPFTIKDIKNIELNEKLTYNWNSKLQRLSKNSIIYHFGLRDLIFTIGKDHFYSDKNWYLGRIRYSTIGLNQISNEIKRLIKSFEHEMKKCLIVDLDNTLWGGIIGEENFDEILLNPNNLGAPYFHFQERIKEIKETGIILAICSKNNFDDAIHVFENHPHMVLKIDDFSIVKINWKSKVENILEISKELNIGLDSIVFLDDNKFERELVSLSLNNVVVPDFPIDSSKLNEFIREVYLNLFYKVEITDEDRVKTRLIKENISRLKFKHDLNEIDYLNNLGMKLNIFTATDKNITRLRQLIYKTNQFNTTTIRYSEKEIMDILYSKEYLIFLANVEDKFGDNGITASIILKLNTINKSLSIESLILSCRIIGRFIEYYLLDFIEKIANELGYYDIYAKVKLTEKNLPAREVYKNAGYLILDSIESSISYILRLNSSRNVKIDKPIIRVISDEN